MTEKRKNTVKFVLNKKSPSSLTEEAKSRLDLLDKREINYDDIPELEEEWFERASHVIHEKKPISLRIDTDILDFFKKSGSRYQTRINAILRAYVDSRKRLEAQDAKPKKIAKH